MTEIDPRIADYLDKAGDVLEEARSEADQDRAAVLLQIAQSYTALCHTAGAFL